MEQQYTYSAFISYRHRSPDREAAIELEHQLERCTVPKAFRGRPELTCVNGKRLYRLFRDEDELPLSTDLGESIRTALNGSAWLLVICTPALLESHWCMTEVETFIKLRGKEKIIPVLVKGTPETSIPPQLLWDTDAQGNAVPRKPLVLDVRAADTAGMKKLIKTEMLRVVAKMLQAEFEDLRQRANLAKMQRLLTAGLAATALAAGITVYTMIQADRMAEQRDIAEAQRVIAEEQKTIAEEQRAIAEEQKGIAEEQRGIAEEQKAIAEEQRTIAEKERHDAIVSTIGILLEKSLSAVSDGDRLQGIRYALDAEEQSRLIDGECREEIRTTLQNAVYNMPFSDLIRVKNDNRLIQNMVGSPDGRYLVGIINDNSMAMVSGSTGEILYTVCDSDEMAIDPQFSPDGSRFLSIGDLGKHVSVWDTETGALVLHHESKAGKPYHITPAMFWGDSDTLLLMDNGTVCSVNVTTGECREIYTAGTHELHFDPTQDLYRQIAGPDAKVTLLTEDASGISMVPSPDGTKILVGGLDATDGVCIINSDGSLYSVLQYMPGILMDEYTFSPDGNTVSVVTEMIGCFGTWDVHTGELLYAYTFSRSDAVSNIVYSADSKTMALAIGQELFVMDARTSEYSWSFKWDHREGQSFSRSLKLTADGRYMTLVDGDLYILDTQKQKLVFSYSIDTDRNINNAVPLQGNTGILMSTSGGMSRIISLPLTASVHEEAAYDGALVTARDPGSSSENGWEPAARHSVSDVIKFIQGGEQPATPYFSPDGQYGVLVHQDGVAEIYHKDRGREPVYVFAEHKNYGIYNVAFTGNIMISLGADNRISLYDLEKGETIRVYVNDSIPQTLALSADGTMFMVPSYDQAIFTVYNIALDEPMFTMVCGEECTAFGFAEDGSAAVVLWEGGALVGDLYPDDEGLLQRARELIGRE